VIEIRCQTGREILPHLADLARLRIEVFRAWPYLYDGDIGYEEKYLETYSDSAESLFVLAFDGDRVIGASTGIPLHDEVQSLQKPFVDKEIPLASVFYFGESVLLPAFRGRGLGHRFFDEREGYARRLGRFSITAFCAVEREPGDPRRPADYRGNDIFWSKRGYRKRIDMQAALEWKDLDANVATEKRLAFWTRPIESGR
jgi:GNAT superfamily N-acetyltransferase